MTQKNIIFPTHLLFSTIPLAASIRSVSLTINDLFDGIFSVGPTKFLIDHFDSGLRILIFIR